VVFAVTILCDHASLHIRSAACMDGWMDGGKGMEGTDAWRDGGMDMHMYGLSL
jgi:hypothetical protein